MAILCDKCKHFFNLHFDFISGEHNCCDAENCYLCNCNNCYDYEEGDVPEGEVRGEWYWDRDRRLGIKEDEDDEL